METRLKKERKQKLDFMLRPITWSLESSISSRQNLVNSRRRDVALIYTFLNKQEKKRADKWFAKEQHSGLWD